MGKVIPLFPGNKGGNQVALATKEDLQALKEEILLAIKSMCASTGQPAPRKWLKSFEVKKMLGISTGTLQTLRSNGDLPFTKMGGTMYYDPEDIEAVLQKQKRQGLTAVPIGSNHLKIKNRFYERGNQNESGKPTSNRRG